jgi:sugar phosphate isomerase/epimerase
MLGMSRRALIGGTSSFLASSAVRAIPCNSVEIAIRANQLSFCLNTATIRGQNLPLDQQLKIAKEAGYDGIEPWLGDMDKYVASGKSLADLGKWAKDNNLAIEGCIGFPEWLSNDLTKRKNSLEQLKKDLEKLIALGCRRFAAPPAGATQEKNIPLSEASERFSPLAQLCLDAKITPLVEIWGFSSSVNRLGDALYIASECGQSGASILADIYHLRRGGSGLTGLNQLGSHSLQILHVNDYPGRTKPKDLNDSDRVFPGEGAAPWNEIRQIIGKTSPNCVISLELFNRDVWKMMPQKAILIGLQKMKNSFEGK